MSSIAISDLAASRTLDTQAMSRVRGGIALPNVNVNVNLDQVIGQFQNIQVDVLNNDAVIGADLGGLGLAGAPWGRKPTVTPM